MARALRRGGQSEASSLGSVPPDNFPFRPPKHRAVRFISTCGDLTHAFLLLWLMGDRSRTFSI